MTLQQALYAVTIAEKGSFNAAANELLVSQSCLSSSVRELEKEFHISLFIRTNRGVTLTSEGSAERRKLRRSAPRLSSLHCVLLSPVRRAHSSQWSRPSWPLRTIARTREIKARFPEKILTRK